MAFDRLWSVYLENKLKIKRNKKNVMIFILIVLSFVFIVDQVYMLYFVKNIKYPLVVYNMTLNKSLIVVINLPICTQTDSNIILAQNLISIIMRIVLPFIIMIVCNIILINHIRKSRNRVIRGRNEKKNNNFTFSVIIMNAYFIICNIEVVVYFIIFYYNVYGGGPIKNVPYYIFTLYGTCSILLSYFFTISQFLVDIIFNKVFRKEILVSVLFLTGRRNQIEETRGGNTQN